MSIVHTSQFGHVCKNCVDNVRLARIAYSLYTGVQVDRQPGRPRKKWIDNIEEDSRQMHIPASEAETVPRQRQMMVYASEPGLNAVVKTFIVVNAYSAGTMRTRPLGVGVRRHVFKDQQVLFYCPRGVGQATCLGDSLDVSSPALTCIMVCQISMSMAAEGAERCYTNCPPGFYVNITQSSS